jgi:hypothetical protein
VDAQRTSLVELTEFFSKTISHRSISKAPVDVVAAFLLATATPALIHHCLEAKI